MMETFFFIPNNSHPPSIDIFLVRNSHNILDSISNTSKMEHKIETTGRSRAKTEGKKGGAWPQNWQTQKAQESVYPQNTLHTPPMS